MQELMPTPGWGWIYRRTQQPVKIVQVKPTRGWPHHTLRAIFDDGKSAFTFHADMLEVWFCEMPTK